MDTSTPLVFRRLYTDITTLHDFLTHAISNSTKLGSSFPTLLLPDDAPTFRAILDSCFLACNSGSISSDRRFIFSLDFIQADIVKRAIEDETRTSRRPQTKNVICAEKNKHSLASTHSSNSFRILTSEPWITLHSRIGDDLMFHLLTKKNLFLTFPGPTYLQLAGFPASISAFAKNRRARKSNSLPAVKKSAKSHDGPNNVSERQPTTQPNSPASPCQLASIGWMTWQDSEMDASEALGGAPTPELETQEVSRFDESTTQGEEGSRKRRRLSKKRRLKQKLAKEATGCQRQLLHVLEAGNCKEPSKASGGPRDDASRNLPGQSFQNRPISRSRMFFNEWFRKVPGLSSSHPLLRLPADQCGARQLYSDIFGSSNLDTKQPPSNRRTAVQVVAHLQQTLKRAKSCRVAHYLKTHCPLPSRFNESSWRHTQPRPGSTNFEPDSPTWSPSNPLPGSLNLDTQSPGWQGPSGLPHSLGNSPGWQEALPGGVAQLGGTDVAGAPSWQEDADMAGSESEQASELSTGGPWEDGYVTQEDEKESNPLQELLGEDVPRGQVASFVWCVLQRMVARPLLGSKVNRRHLRALIGQFLGRKRSEMVDLSQLMMRVKVSGYSWQGRAAMAADWLFWMFDQLVVPLVGAHFYVTDTEHRRNDVLFYRKPVWARIRSMYLNSTASNTYERITAGEAYLAMKDRSLGFSKARLIPKRSSVRPVANLGSSNKMELPRVRAQPLALGNLPGTFPGSPPTGPLSEVEVPAAGDAGSFREVAISSSKAAARFRQRLAANRRLQFLLRWQAALRNAPPCLSFKSVNSVLSNSWTCLKTMWRRLPEHLGCSVFGYDDVYSKLKTFLETLQGQGSGLRPQLYFAVCDVSKAFDSINGKLLCTILEDFISEQNFEIWELTSVRPMFGRLKVGTETMAVLEGHDVARQLEGGRTRCQSILENKGYLTSVEASEIKSLLGQLVGGNIVKFGGNFYAQKVGIPQGSVVSSFLCSLFYGHLENNVLLPLIGGGGARTTNERSPSSILMRFIDDSLLISTDRNQVSRFIEAMHGGFPTYGCRANKEKTSVSFDLALENGEKINRNEYVSRDGKKFIKWAGLLIGTTSLEIRADYTRYWDVPISSTVVVNWGSKNQGSAFLSKLFAFMRPKCHPLLFDSTINSPLIVHLNCYQAFVLCAMKAHHYICQMPMGAQKNPTFFLKSFLRTFNYMYGLIEIRMKNAERQLGRSVSANLDESRVVWLGMMAFSKVLKRKINRYKGLLVLMKQRLKSNKYKSFGENQFLLDVIDSRNLDILEPIKY